MVRRGLGSAAVVQYSPVSRGELIGARRATGDAELQRRARRRPAGSGPWHRADDAKRELRLALTNAFVTPIDSEDIYVMSERLDPDRRGKAGASATEAADRVWYATVKEG